jgi:hypothetical protein
MSDAGPAGFRSAQIAAIHEVSPYFCDSVVTTPNGSCKTAALVVLSFVPRANRALLVMPSRLVPEQIAENLAAVDVAIARSTGTRFRADGLTVRFRESS